MTIIKTRRGWRQLGDGLVTYREIWELQKDGSIEYEGDTYDPLPEAPPRYRGPIPSFDARAYITRIRKDIDDSREHRNKEPIIWDDPLVW